MPSNRFRLNRAMRERMHTYREYDKGGWKKQKGGIDSKLYEGLSKDDLKFAKSLNAPHSDGGRFGVGKLYFSDRSRRKAQSMGSRWQDAAWGMGMGTVNKAEEMQTLIDAVREHGGDFKSAQDVQNVIASISKPKVVEEEAPVIEEEEAPVVETPNPLDVLPPHNEPLPEIEEYEAPPPPPPPTMIGAGGDRGLDGGNASGVRPNRSKAWKTGLSSKGTTGNFGREGMKIKNLNLKR